MNLYDHVTSGRPHGFRMVGPDPSLLHSRIVALDMMLSHHACLSRVRNWKGAPGLSPSDVLGGDLCVGGPPQGMCCVQYISGSIIR